MRLRHAIDWPVLWRFGIPSAAGGVAGALWQGERSNLILTRVLGGLLVLAGVSGLANLTVRVQLRGPLPILGGLLSGFFGGLVGNQGGIRSAALLGVSLPPQRFVATATASAMVVDAVRLWERVLRRLPEDQFRRIVSGFLVVLA